MIQMMLGRELANKGSAHETKANAMMRRVVASMRVRLEICMCLGFLVLTRSGGLPNAANFYQSDFFDHFSAVPALPAFYRHNVRPEF